VAFDPWQVQAVVVSPRAPDFRAVLLLPELLPAVLVCNCLPHDVLLLAAYASADVGTLAVALTV
jgi:hypothetical protein